MCSFLSACGYISKDKSKFEEYDHSIYASSNPSSSSGDPFLEFNDDDDDDSNDKCSS